MRKDFDAYGIPQEFLDDILETEAERDFEVYEENWQSLEVFLYLETQWQYGFSGTLQCIPVERLKLVMEWLNVGCQKTVWRDIQVMERAVIKAQSEAGKDNGSAH